MNTFLAFDTSNYTTSFAVCSDGAITENRKIPLPVDEGKRGLRQSDAVFHHTVHLASLTHGLTVDNVCAVGVSDKPRNVEGSYMPCFLTGVAGASVLADTLRVPLYRFSHQQGHVMAALYSAGMSELYEQKTLAFHLSGGTTELLLCEKGVIERIGSTLDISAGKLIDRTGVKLGMHFPCGPELDRLSQEVDLPKVKVKTSNLSCNLSGFENKIDKMISDGASREDVSAYAIACVIGAVEGMLEGALTEHGDLPVVFAGGVSSNFNVRKYFKENYSAIFPEPVFALDNAAGIALLTQREYDRR